MKRHGFGGQPASHGVSLTHRSMGSAGGGQGSGSRVHPGKRMPGRMGGERVTVQNLKVLKVDPENGLVVVNGKTATSSAKLDVTNEGPRMREWTKRMHGENSGCSKETMARDSAWTSFSRAGSRTSKGDYLGRCITLLWTHNLQVRDRIISSASSAAPENSCNILFQCTQLRF